MRLAARTDSTHAAVVTAFRNCGAKVHDTSRLGRGFPDLVVNWHGHLWIVEVKSITGKLRRDQELFMRDFPMVKIVRSASEAYALCGVTHVGEGVAS